MARKVRLVTHLAQAVMAVILGASIALVAPPVGVQATALASSLAAVSSEAASTCASQSGGPSPALLSSILQSALPAGSPSLSALPLFSPASGVIAVPTPAPASLAPEIEASIATMRAQSRLNVQWQATLLAPAGFGRLTLSPPDQVEGQGAVASTTWAIKSAGDHLTVQVNDSAAGDLPSKGMAATLRDLILDIPCDVPNAVVTHDGSTVRFAGRLSPGSGSGLLRDLTGFALPGSPIGDVAIAIDGQTHIWHSLDVRLTWAIVNVNILGQPFMWGPGGRLLLTFGDATSTSPALTTPHPQQTAAQLLLDRLDALSPLRPYSQTIDRAFTVLSVHDVPGMLGDEPSLRLAIAMAWQQHGGNSPEYEDAVRRYREWQSGTPIVGPFLDKLGSG